MAPRRHGKRRVFERLYRRFKRAPLPWLARLRRWVIGEHASAVLVDSANGLLLTPVSDFYIGRKLAQRGAFDARTVEHLSQLVKADADVLFVGAHIGAFLVPIARHCRSVVGVEANPATFRLLELNVIVNRLSNVELFNLAALDGDAAVRFVANKVNTGGSKVLAEHVDRPEFYFDDPDVVEVRGARLDDVLGGRSFDLIVIDVEGSEYRALKGMPETLARAGQVVIEFAPNLIDNVAGITIEQFLAAVPERFTSATLLGEETSYDRRELSVFCNEIWANSYYDTPDLRFISS